MALTAAQTGDGSLNLCPKQPLDCGISTQAVCCCSPAGNPLNLGSAANAGESQSAKFTPPQLQIELPTLRAFSDVKCTANEDGTSACQVPWLGEYVIALYNYGLEIAGILAAIMLMAGGLLWLISGGNATRITRAKELMIGSVVGLIILISSYVLLIQVNPDLVKFRVITIGTVKGLQIEGDSSLPLNLDFQTVSNFLGVNCGQDSVAAIINKSKGKITYSTSNRGQSGPDNTLYFDCSSYASYVAECAGNKDVPAWTGSIFSDRQEFDGNLNSLAPGDLVGWPPGNKDGHVLIYMGNGQFGDCHGGTGKQAGNAIGIYNLEQIKDSATRHSNGIIYVREK